MGGGGGGGGGVIACSGLGVDFVCPHQSGVYQETLSFDGGERGWIGSIQEVIALQGDSRSAQSGVLSAFSGRQFAQAEHGCRGIGCVLTIY